MTTVYHGTDAAGQPVELLATQATDQDGHIVLQLRSPAGDREVYVRPESVMQLAADLAREVDWVARHHPQLAVRVVAGQLSPTEVVTAPPSLVHRPVDPHAQVDACGWVGCGAVPTSGRWCDLHRAWHAARLEYQTVRTAAHNSAVGQVYDATCELEVTAHA